MGVLILNYHRIYRNDESIGKDIENLYSVSIDNFTQQLERINELNIPVIPLSKIDENADSEILYVAITFDDGNTSDFEIAYPILKKFNLTASFFVLVNDKVNWEHLEEMSNSGYEIGSHGLFHKDLTKLKTKALQEELFMSKSRLEKELKLEVAGFSFPFGRFNKKVIHFSHKAGYKQLFSTHFGLISGQNQPFKRWSIKSTTSLSEFENVLTNSAFRNKKEQISKVKQRISKLIGKNASDSLNSFIHKNKQR